MPGSAKIFILLGITFLVLGGLIYLFSRMGISFGKVPGDIRLQSSNATCVIALGASCLLSILLTIVLNIVARIFYR